MKLEGGCYCGSVRYVAEGEPMMKAQCHCRECQYITGGSPNMFVLMPPDGFRYTKGTPKQFTRSDLEGAVTREFCAECGTHMVTRRPGLPAVILKVGTLDDPSLYGSPQMAIFTIDRQIFHQIPEGCRASSDCRNGSARRNPSSSRPSEPTGPALGRPDDRLREREPGPIATEINGCRRPLPHHSNR